MLIRSQDMKSLYNINTNKGLWIRRRTKDVEIIAEGFGHMGAYENNGKAIKVLNKISESYQYNMEYKPTMFEPRKPQYVFQMPQDSEVEE